MKILKLIPILLFCFMCVSCEYLEVNIYKVKNTSDKPIHIEFTVLPENQPPYGDSISNIDTIIPPLSIVELYSQEGGIVCTTCTIEKLKEEEWNIDSLLITIDDTVEYSKFKNYEYWKFRADKSVGHYTLEITDELLD